MYYHVVRCESAEGDAILGGAGARKTDKKFIDMMEKE